VIGELPAATAPEHREASRIEQVGGLGRDAGGVERRVFQQPDQLARLAVGDRAGSGLHRRLGREIGNQRR
jgi:hypothetical protein